MKIKYIQIPLFVLGSLIILSFAFFSVAQEQSTNQKNIFLDSDQDGLSDEEEKIYGTDPQKADTDGDGYADGAEIKAGYDPTRPAPGDKIIPETAPNSPTTDATTTSSENLTEDLLQKISALTDASDTAPLTEVSIAQVQEMIDTSLAENKLTDETAPIITEKDVRIKKQNFNGLSDEARQVKQKENALKYFSAVSYIFFSNYPRPVTSADNLNTVFNSIMQDFSSAFASRNPSDLNDLCDSLQKIISQLKEIEVPETLVNTHLEILQLISDALLMRDSISENMADPLLDVVNLSKMSRLSADFISLITTIESELEKNNIEISSLLEGQELSDRNPATNN